jgi:hypothetical protein
MLRNVIERIFGILKNRFRILLLPPHYTMDIQACIPPALCLVHNVIRVHDPNDMLDYHEVNLDIHQPMYDAGVLAEGPPSNEARNHAHERRDEIARQMWEDFNNVRAHRGLEVVENNLM